MNLFILSCLFGSIAGIIYDLFRMIRIVRYHSIICTAAEDILFFAAYSAFTVVFTLEAGRGEYRFYYTAGNILGFILYHFSVGNTVTGSCLRIVNHIKHFLSKHKIIPLKMSFYNKNYQKTLE